MSAEENRVASETKGRENQELLEKIYKSVERTRKMFLWTLILSVIAFILPLVGLAFAVPYFISTYLSTVSTVITQFGL